MENIFQKNMTQGQMATVDGAILMTKLGFKSFPVHGIKADGSCTCAKGNFCGDAGKHPMVSGWQNFEFKNEFEIREFWVRYPYANYAVNTTGYVVIDIDERNGGYESYKEFIEQSVGLCNTLTVKTGSGGNSRHIFYMVNNTFFKNKTGVFPGVDVKSSGGFVVGPYSKHKSGNYYEIISFDRENPKIDILPNALVKVLKLTEVDDKSGNELTLNPFIFKNESKTPVAELARFKKYSSRLDATEGRRNNSVVLICREGLALGISIEEIRAEFQRFIFGDFTTNEAERVLSAQQRYHEKKPFIPFSIEISLLEIARHAIDAKRDPLTGDSTLRLVDGELYRYENGTYSLVEEKKFIPELRNELNLIPDFVATTHKVREVYEHIKSEVLHREKTKNNFFFEVRTLDKFIAMSSSVLNLSELFKNVIQLFQLTPKFFTTAKLPFDFNPNSECPTFLKILDRILPDKDDQRMLQQWFGYHLLDTVSFGKLLILMGAGANGKSVVLKVLRLFLGESNISSVPLESFSSQARFAVAETHGKLGNIYDEMSSNKIDESFIKNYVTGGRVQCERKYEHPFSFTPTAKLTFSTNVMPEINDRSDGFWRRTMILKFNETILPSEQNQNFLEDSFWLKSGELSGVFNWALQGAREIMACNSLYESQNAKNSLVQTRIESDNVRQWINENIVFEVGAYLDRTQAYNLYKDFVVNQSLKPFPAHIFFKEIEKMFPKAIVQSEAISISHRRARGFHNIRLNTGNTGIL